MVAPAALSAAGSSVLSILSFLITLRVAGALVRRARLARLRRGALGPLGEVLSPLWPLLVFLPLVASGALPAPADGTAPLVYAALGYLTWSLLVETTLAPARGLAEHVGPGLAPASRMLAGALEAGRRALIRAAVLLPLAVLGAAGGAWDPAGLARALALLVPGLVLAGAVGLLLALWLAPWRDGVAGAGAALRLTLLPSLVLFPLPEAAWAEVLTALNPLALWTDAVRALALGASLPRAGPVLAWSALGLGLVALALRAARVLDPVLRGGLR